MSKNYWLIKSEEACYSIDDMKKDKKTAWSGIRNHQVKNCILKEIKIGDLALFYHSNGKPSGAVGVVKVTSRPYPDPTQFDRKDEHFDPKACKEKPIWYVVDMKFVQKFKRAVLLPEIKNDPKLRGIMVAEKGNMLSVQPVSPAHFEHITYLGKS
ncbi:MAG: hypothetical protein QG669_312 [Patescibacteria group bacterium]|jgi:predicted RNA-binding protein with PUA-like domain|nr:hypothetical protein [Patescibacteria group bacterium]